MQIFDELSIVVLHPTKKGQFPRAQFLGQTPHVSCKVPLLTLEGCKVPVDSSLLLDVFFVFFPITVCIVQSENIAVCIVRAISSHGSSPVPSDPHNQYTIYV